VAAGAETPAHARRIDKHQEKRVVFIDGLIDQKQNGSRKTTFPEPKTSDESIARKTMVTAKKNLVFWKGRRPFVRVGVAWKRGEGNDTAGRQG
jgi:hypothetical protein